MTRQEIFNTVADHLLAQGRPAMRIGTKMCAYRSADGATCAVGCLIPDTHYTPEMEGTDFLGLVSRYDDLPDYFYTNTSLFTDLQQIHDWGVGRESELPLHWYETLLWLAEGEKLEPSPRMKEFEPK